MAGSLPPAASGGLRSSTMEFRCDGADASVQALGTPIRCRTAQETMPPRKTPPKSTRKSLERFVRHNARQCVSRAGGARSSGTCQQPIARVPTRTGVRLPIRSGIAYNAGMPAGASIREQAAASVDATPARSLYIDDVWTWSRTQVAALRRGDWGALDLQNVIEEIEDVGNRHSDAWTSFCTNVISHLLKIEYSGSGEDFRHWREEIEAWRDSMFDVLTDSPGIKHELSGLLAKAWKRGRRDAVRELVQHGGAVEAAVEKRLRRSWELQLPQECPYTLAEIAGYEPLDKQAAPQLDVLPVPVARVLNERLGTHSPVRPRSPERSGSRGR